MFVVNWARVVLGQREQTGKTSGGQWLSR